MGERQQILQFYKSVAEFVTAVFLLLLIMCRLMCCLVECGKKLAKKNKQTYIL